MSRNDCASAPVDGSALGTLTLCFAANLAASNDTQGVLSPSIFCIGPTLRYTTPSTVRVENPSSSPPAPPASMSTALRDQSNEPFTVTFEYLPLPKLAVTLNRPVDASAVVSA